MIREHNITIVNYSAEYQSSIRKILTKIGWAEQYISAMEHAANVFSNDKESYGVYLAISNENAIGYLYVQYYAWNQLCQIQGLAISPEFQRQGAATALVWRAEAMIAIEPGDAAASRAPISCNATVQLVSKS